MKKTSSIPLVIATLLVMTTAAGGQNLITFDVSQGASNFIFTNSKGEKSDDFQSIGTGAYSIGFRRESGKGDFYRFNAGARKAGAKFVNDQTQTSWHLNYFDLKAGVGYELGKWKIRPYLSIALYYSFLTGGIQSMDGSNFDLKAEKDLKSFDFGVQILPGAKVKLSEHLWLFGEVAFLRGLVNLETDENQKLNNKGFFITLGLAVSLSKSKPKWIQGKH